MSYPIAVRIIYPLLTKFLSLADTNFLGVLGWNAIDTNLSSVTSSLSERYFRIGSVSMCLHCAVETNQTSLT